MVNPPAMINAIPVYARLVIFSPYHLEARIEPTTGYIRAATAAKAPPTNPIAMNDPNIAIGPPKIAARKNHLEHGLNSIIVLFISPNLPRTPFQTIRANITVKALNAVINTAVTINDTPSPFVAAISPYIASKGLRTHTTVPGMYHIPQRIAQKKAHMKPILTLLLCSCVFKACKSIINTSIT